jgi:hypothetical protein
MKEDLCVAESARGGKEGEENQRTLYVFYLYIYICHISAYLHLYEDIVMKPTK